MRDVITQKVISVRDTMSARVLQMIYQDFLNAINCTPENYSDIKNPEKFPGLEFLKDQIYIEDTKAIVDSYVTKNCFIIGILDKEWRREKNYYVYSLYDIYDAYNSDDNYVKRTVLCEKVDIGATLKLFNANTSDPRRRTVDNADIEKNRANIAIDELDKTIVTICNKNAYVAEEDYVLLNNPYVTLVSLAYSQNTNSNVKNICGRVIFNINGPRNSFFSKSIGVNYSYPETKEPPYSVENTLLGRLYNENPDLRTKLIVNGIEILGWKLNERDEEYDISLPLEGGLLNLFAIVKEEDEENGEDPEPTQPQETEPNEPQDPQTPEPGESEEDGNENEQNDPQTEEPTGGDNNDNEPEQQDPPSGTEPSQEGNEPGEPSGEDQAGETQEGSGEEPSQGGSEPGNEPEENGGEENPSNETPAETSKEYGLIDTSSIGAIEESEIDSYYLLVGGVYVACRKDDFDEELEDEEPTGKLLFKEDVEYYVIKKTSE